MATHLVQFFKDPLSRAIGLVFYNNGFMFGTWSAMIPVIKSRFGLNPAELGLLLLCLPLGTTVGNPLGAWIVKRYQAPRVTPLLMTGSILLLSIPLLSSWLALTIPGLLVAGMCMSATNIAMNTCSTHYELTRQSLIMSVCHGMWSLGAMSGSALSGFVLGLGLWPTVVLGAIILATLINARYIRRALIHLKQLTFPAHPAARGFTWPNRYLWMLIIISMCVFLVEGTMVDWAGVYMKETVQAPTWIVGLGYGTYALFMATGRLFGDVLIGHFGRRKMLSIGGIISASGFIIAILFPYTAAVLVGFAIIGCGVATGAPILYSAASRVPGIPQESGLASMNMFAMVAFLAGPVVIGFIAAASSLGVAYGLVAGVALVGAYYAHRVLSE